MSTRSSGRWTRNAAAALAFETFFIAAVASFLGIRSFLAVTGYPRIGSEGIHIAHMLWGGLLMLAALMLLFAFLDRSVQRLAAVLAGLGFGTFVDEIGKFVTADNNYFYRPAVALIYGLFVLLFLVARTLVGQRPLSEKEALANAVVLLAGRTAGPIEADDRAEIDRLLERADPASPLARLAERYLAALPGAPEQHNVAARIHQRLARGYQEAMATPWAERALTASVLAYAAAAVVGVAVIATATETAASPERDTWGVAVTAQIVSTILGAGLVARGVFSLHASRMDAYRWFERGVLVWILLTQVFVFYSSQLAGLGGLVVDLVAYGSLRFALTHEAVPAHPDLGAASHPG